MAYTGVQQCSGSRQTSRTCNDPQFCTICAVSAVVLHQTVMLCPFSCQVDEVSYSELECTEHTHGAKDDSLIARVDATGYPDHMHEGSAARGAVLMLD